MRTSLLVLIVVFVALVAILLRLAEFSGRRIRQAPVRPAPPAVVLFNLSDMRPV